MSCFYLRHSINIFSCLLIERMTFKELSKRKKLLRLTDIQLQFVNNDKTAEGNKLVNFFASDDLFLLPKIINFLQTISI